MNVISMNEGVADWVEGVLEKVRLVNGMGMDGKLNMSVVQGLDRGFNGAWRGGGVLMKVKGDGAWLDLLDEPRFMGWIGFR
ncbi:hypothetical protein [Bacillus subtilis]|uniref:hypothetical protein n=1 Tax=Bacillus subtilis TaxID=1423 RepID=UPI00119F0E0B|nr:hypothetical protein [Bacillus subtilis]